MVQPLDPEVDHVRGDPDGRLILEYGDYECPYSRMAFREVQRVESRAPVRFAFRHFPLTEIHPHALAAAAAAEAAALQGRFWEMHELLFHRQKALEEDDLRGYAEQVGLDLARFDGDRGVTPCSRGFGGTSRADSHRGEVRGTPTLFIDGVLHEGSYDVAALLGRLRSDPA